MKSETSGVIWHVASESKIQLVNCDLSPYFTLLCSSSLDIHAIDAYILWSSLSSPLLHAQLPFSLKHTCFRRFSLSFGGLGHFLIMWSSDPHLKHFRGGRSKFLLDETSTASFLVFLSNHFETFFRRMIITSTKCALCLNRVCSQTMSTRTWSAVKI